MTVDPTTKYRPSARVDLPDRRWPDRAIDRPPIWCSVDLRDGNQALVEPMDSERKLRMYDQLVAMGFKEIEVGFPASSETDFRFIRELIEGGRIPEDVTIQVLTQSREPLIRRTMESIRGARRAIVHLYNNTSPLQRRVVFRLPRAGIVDVAVSGARLIRELCATLPETEVVLEYSPESFSETELEFSVEVCEAVMAVWEPSPEHPILLNLPSTVEAATPNVFADQIEWFGRRVRNRESAILSVHPHNDRGTAVATAELAVMAGAERVEGTLFGNGERTGNVDLVTLALNLWTQGVDPGIEIGDIDALIGVAEYCNRLPVHARHPYAGELVHTAFSGSHQDAIKKGFAVMRETAPERWEVPYLPIDPADVGRTYESVVRVNSQSGKGGISYLLERDYALELPRGFQVELRELIQVIADATGEEVSSESIWDAFEVEYLRATEPLELLEHWRRPGAGVDGEDEFEFAVRFDGEVRDVRGRGNGPVAAFAHALEREYGVKARVTHFSEHALGEGADAMAIAYVEVTTPEGVSRWGAARDANLAVASLRAVASALNRARVA